MDIRLVLCPYEDPAEGLDWPEQTPIIHKRIADHLSAYPDGEIDYRIEESDHGIGADWSTTTVVILGIANLIFFGIPALHKKFRETLSEWKRIKQNADKLVNWIRGKEAIFSYSTEYAFLEVLQYLAPKVDILNLELIAVTEIYGKSGSTSTSFETTGLIYYLFAFRENDERCIITLIDSQLNVIFSKSMGLDYRYKQKFDGDI